MALNRFFEIIGWRQREEIVPVEPVNDEPQTEIPAMPTYTKVDEQLINDVESRAGGGLRSWLMEKMYYLDRYQHYGYPRDIYDGLYIREEAGQRQLIVSPLKVMEQAEMMTLKIGGVDHPIFLHSSQDMRQRMADYMRWDRDTYIFMATAHTTLRLENGYGGYRHHSAMSLLSQQLGIREYLLPDFERYTTQQMGKEPYYMNSHIYRVEPAILMDVGANFEFRPPQIDDFFVPYIERMQSLSKIFERATGKRIGASSYDAHPGRLISSYYYADFHEPRQPQVVEEITPDIMSIFIPGMGGFPELHE